ncbi:hypothetical protein [Patulibacter defluvii]|uniref:hypothetical protein n=1 Tax=Patulibacter defluvii TaxID=3095358 RepID=UPI002A75F1B1|nr:hypothetical protein [Patulibacter sp. DM4]
MPDPLDLLRTADPCPQPPSADAPAARAILARSLAAARRRPSPRPALAADAGLVAATAARPVAHRSRRPVLGAGVALAAAAAALVVAVGPGGSVDARAAVLRAAAALPVADSGRVTIDQRNVDDATGADLGSSHQELRFDGDDVALSGSGTRLVDGRPRRERLAEVRRVDGRVAWNDGRGWRPAPADGPALLPDGVGGPATREAAQALVGALRDVRASGGAYAGTISHAALREAYARFDPASVARLAAVAGPIAVRVAVDADGVLANVRFTTRGPWQRPARASVTSVLELDYGQLGRPQAIAAPPAG